MSKLYNVLSLFLTIAALIVLAASTETDIREYPNEVALRYKSCSECVFEHVCAGSLYNSTVVITSASCFEKDTKPSNFLVVAGSNLRDGSDGSVAILHRIVTHENHQVGSVQNDIAIIFLKTPLRVNNGEIGVADLVSRQPAAGSEGVVLGWNREKELGNVLQKIDVELDGNENCQQIFAPNQISVDTLCAVPADGVACQLGAGSALLVGGKLAGILSPAADCTKETDLYANVGNLQSWIERTFRGEKPAAVLEAKFL